MDDHGIDSITWLQDTAQGGEGLRDLFFRVTHGSPERGLPASRPPASRPPTLIILLLKRLSSLPGGPIGCEFGLMVVTRAVSTPPHPGCGRMGAWTTRTAT